MKLFAPVTYWDLTPDARDAICNGCGPRSKFDFIPDSIFGLNIEEACNIHDFMYKLGTKTDDKEEADRVFLNNMLRLIESDNRWLKMLRRRRALEYYEAVVAFGGPAFWEGKNPPGNLGTATKE